MSDIRCDIILPVCDQFQFTKNCIESIIAKTRTPYRIIVINNGKNEETKSYLAEAKKKLGDKIVIVQNQTNIGWVKALNQGIAMSSSPYLVFQNDDTVVTENWLGKMIKILEENENIGIVNPSWELRPNYMSIDDYGKLVEKKNRGKFIETDWARGFSVVVKRKVIERIGNIDEVYGLAYFDDWDFSVRAINAGFLVVLALDTYVYHHRNVTFFEVLKGPKWNELFEKNRIIYYAKWGKPLRVLIVLDKDSCKDNVELNGIVDTVFYLARKQHHVYVWSPFNVGQRFRHTNVIFNCYNKLLLRPAVLLEIYLNSKKKDAKRYNAVFSFDRKIGRFMLRHKIWSGLPVYIDTGERNYGRFIKSQMDAMQERTKENPVG